MLHPSLTNPAAGRFGPTVLISDSFGVDSGLVALVEIMCLVICLVSNHAYHSCSVNGKVVFRSMPL